MEQYPLLLGTTKKNKQVTTSGLVADSVMSTPFTAHINEIGVVTVVGPGLSEDSYTTMVNLLAAEERRNGPVDSYVLTCWESVPDSARALILGAGWPLKDATQADQKARNKESWDRIAAEVYEPLVNSRAAQDADHTSCSGTPPTVTAGNAATTLEKDGKTYRLVRTKTPGFSYSDGVPEWSDGWLKKAGAEILYSAEALTKQAAFVGTLQGSLTETCYLLDGKRFYLYSIVSNVSGDDPFEEWWVSDVRLWAEDAGDAIVAARNWPADRKV